MSGLYQITKHKVKGKRTLKTTKELVYLAPELWEIIYDFKNRLEHRENHRNMIMNVNSWSTKFNKPLHPWRVMGGGSKIQEFRWLSLMRQYHDEWWSHCQLTENMIVAITHTQTVVIDGTIGNELWKIMRHVK